MTQKSPFTALIASAFLLVASHAWSAEPAVANIGQLKNELRNYHANGYPSDLAAVSQEAEHWIRERAGKVKKPALVLDIDETSLSNWPELDANDFAYIAEGNCDFPPKMPCGATAWERSARALPIEPTLRVYALASQLKVAVFFITGRLEDPAERAATELNLWKAGYRGWEKVVLRPDRSGTVAAYKSGARAAIEADGYTIIANIGDQQSDLDCGHAEKAFKMPNPFYFIP